jgi:DNA repair protein RadA/Sms
MGLRLYDQDVFVNVIGGLKIDEPAADLAIAAAIASSAKDVPIRADTVLIGEVGLSGELRWVSQMNTRLREAAKLGFKGAIIPQRVHRNEKLPEGIRIEEARSLREALELGLKVL